MTRANPPFLSSGAVGWAAFYLLGAMVFVGKIREFPIGTDGRWALGIECRT